MSRNMYCAAFVWGTMMLLSTPGTASAQWFSRWYDPCRTCRPVVRACYRTVPVTEYRQVRQTVQRPVYETKYVDRQVTEYQQVTEQRTAEVPTLDYVNVTENRTVTRDMGRWNTHYQHRPRMAPCQYDNRPGMIGWFNRTGYSIRSSFVPRVIARRQYVPNVVTYNVPITRRVAQHGTRKVTYNVTRMVPRTTTHKVAVNTVRYVSQEIVRSHPVTVMRQVPIGTATAYGFSPYGVAPQTALRPHPDAIGGPSRSADRRNDEYRNDQEPQHFERDSSRNSKLGADAQPISHPVYQNESEPSGLVPVPQAQHGRRSVPSIVQVGHWMPHRVAYAGP